MSAGTQWSPCYTVNPACTPELQVCCTAVRGGNGGGGNGSSSMVCRTIPWDPVYTSPAITAVVANSPPTFQVQQPVGWTPDCCSPGPAVFRQPSYGANCNYRRYDCELAVGAKSVKPTVKPASRELPDNFKMIHNVHQKYLGRGGEVTQLLTVGATCCPSSQPCYPVPMTACMTPCSTVCASPCPPVCSPVCTPICQSVCPSPCPQNVCSPCMPVCSSVGYAPLRHVTLDEVCRDRGYRCNPQPMTELQRIFAYRRQLELERECQEAQMQYIPHNMCLPVCQRSHAYC